MGRALEPPKAGADPSLQFTGILTATPRVLKRAGLALQDLDWIEINEAFASVPLMWLREFEVFWAD